jgi:hypothetical protein
MTDAMGSNAIVWITVQNRYLEAWDADNGDSLGGADLAQLPTGASDLTLNVQNFQTPIVVGGRIFVATDNKLVAVKP